MRKRNQVIGATLIEIIMAIGIAMLILLASMKMYKQYKLDADAQQVKSNVDTLFRAMEKYYGANCYGTTDPTKPRDQRTPGALSGTHGNYTVDRSTQLVTYTPVPVYGSTNLLSGFLTTQLVTTNINNASAYYAQFNQTNSAEKLTLPLRWVCLNSDCSKKVGAGWLVKWRSQVAVQLKASQNPIVYLNLLGGNCLSEVDPRNSAVIKPCAGSPGSGTYVVWERSITDTSSRGQGNLSLSDPTTTFFTNMYTTDPITHLTGKAAEEGYMPNGSFMDNSGRSLNQEFNCGN